MKNTKKSGKKPSDLCKSELKYHNVKSASFLKKYFSDIDTLVSAIEEYKRVSNIKKDEYSLSDLLK